MSDEQITLFDSVGFAIADFSGLRYARAATQDTDLQASSLTWLLARMIRRICTRW